MSEQSLNPINPHTEEKGAKNRFGLNSIQGRLTLIAFVFIVGTTVGMRSEERRVGKECRSRWSPYH